MAISSLDTASLQRRCKREISLADALLELFLFHLIAPRFLIKLSLILILPVDFYEGWLARFFLKLSETIDMRKGY